MVTIYITVKTKNIFRGAVLFLLLLSSPYIKSQDSVVKKNSPVKTIWDIPHKTAWEKWMWIHRSIVLKITSKRPVKHDTAYIRSFKNRFVVTIPVSNRFLRFGLIDVESGNKLVFAPNLHYNLGFCISSRWVTFIVNSRIKIYSGDAKIKGQTKYRDYQISLYGQKITTDLFMQYYDGFYIKNSRSYSTYTNEKPYEIRADVSAINIGVNTYYIANHKKFSYRNSFAFTEQQKKSAGSFLYGAYYSYFEVNSDPVLVSDAFRSSFDSLSYIRSGHTHNFGLNIGYIYTLVFLKKFYTTVSLVQGLGGKNISYTRENNSHYNQVLTGSGKLNIRFGVGYDHGRYFIGTMGLVDYFLFGGQTHAAFDYSLGKFMVYAGYRFSTLKAEKRLLRRLKLTDY